jgi:glycosyltransferase involved in cell wall biosynthesis
VVIANDWPALVVAAAYKRAHGGKIHYDTHEFATLEFDERWWWRTVYKPMVRRLESGSLDAADGISTVGDRLADALASHYDLPARPAVVRNIPDGISLPDVAPAQWPLRILYHGRVLPDRGLETLLLSVKQWTTPHHVTIRGDGDGSYIAQLKSIVAAEGIGGQVTFAQAVPPRRVMPVAAETADLGVHFTPLGTDQRHFSLPNKVFEYIGAGLAIAVSPGADLKALVEAHGVGVIAHDDTAGGAAAAINSLTQQSVDAFKHAARRAARTLCWAKERHRLAEALAPLLPDRPSSRSH